MNKIIYDNITWYINKTGYYWNFKHGKLHRYVWVKHNGPIPKGYCIHHIDEDKLNNDITNLMLLTNNEHTAIHKQSEITKLKFKEGIRKYIEDKKNNNGYKKWTKREINKYKKGEGIYYW